MNCHMIFDVKMEYLKRTARFLEGGHMTKTLATITYATIVYRETVRTNLTFSELNYFTVDVADIQNAYIMAPVTENI